MASKQMAAILTIVGGVFYIIGGIALALLLESISSLTTLGFSSGSLPGFPGLGSGTGVFSPGAVSGGIDAVAETIAVFGAIAGALIIFGGVLINSENAGRRKAGVILATVMMLLGILPTFGGFLIGLLLAAIGVYLGFTYKSDVSRMLGLGPVGYVAMGAQPGAAGAPAGTGPLNYCIKCGSPIRAGAVFCGACGARL